MSTMMASNRRPGRLWIETGPSVAHRHEVAEHEPAPRVGRQHGPGRHQCPLVPVDHGAERLHDDQRPYPAVLQHSQRGIAEPESAHRHVEVGASQVRQREPGHLDLGHREQTRHQIVVVELDLVHLGVEDRIVTAAQADGPDRRRLPVEFLEAGIHLIPVRASMQQNLLPRAASPTFCHAGPG